MWKRLQRVGKEASKFQFTISYQELTIDCQNNWYPKSIFIVWSRRRRQEKSEMHPLVADPDVNQRFLTSWNVPENFIAVVTLFQSSRHSRFEPKEWSFTVYENELPLAWQTLNLSDYAGRNPVQIKVDLPLKSRHKNVRAASLHFTISCAFIKQGKATEDDLLSISSLMSMEKNQGEQQFARSKSERWTSGRGLEKKKRRRRRTSLILSPQQQQPGTGDYKVSGNLAKRYNLARYLEEYELAPVIDENIEEDEQRQKSLPCNRGERADGSPTEALMDWCLEVTKGYTCINVKDMTTSWRNGLAFCAIFHHYRPDLIDFNSLDPSDICGNCKLAFEIGEKLGIPRVIEPSDMVLLLVPDKLSIMTYLFQLKSFFTDSYDMEEAFWQSRPENRAVPKVEERSPSPHSVVSIKIPSLEKNQGKKVNLGHHFPSPGHQQSCSSGWMDLPSTSGVAGSPKSFSPTRVHDSRSPSKTVPSSDQSREDSGPLMTRKQLLNPFDSDEDENLEQGEEKTVALSTLPQRTLDEQTNSSLALESNRTSEHCMGLDQNSHPSGPNPMAPPRPNRVKSRYEELREEARQRLARARKQWHSSIPDDGKPPSLEKDLERQRVLRERARQIIEETKSSRTVTEIIGAMKNIYDSPQSLRGSLRRCPRDDLSAFGNEPNYYFNFAEEDIETVKEATANGTGGNSNILERAEDGSPKPEMKPPRPPPPLSFVAADAEGSSRSQYVSSEMEDLEREQLEVDEKAAQLEWELRRIMKHGNSKELEEEKLKEWFGLVNQKNALIRRQMQLNLLEKERDLEKRFDLLSIELRKVMSEPDWMKTNDMRRRETMLLAELMELVDKRDELVQSMDTQERAIEEDEKMEMLVDQRLSKKRKKRRRKDTKPTEEKSPSIKGTSPSANRGGPPGCVIQ